MAAPDKAPKKKMGRPPKPPEERLRENKITVQVRRDFYDQVVNLVAEASRIRGTEISLSSACAVLLDAGLDNVSAQAIAKKATS